MYKLIIEDDEGKTTVVPLIRDEITIGRKEGNTIRLTERNVSRRHAKLLKQNGSVFIEDLTSYNGIKVNGDRISGRAPVNEGDRIQIGDYQLALKLDKATAAAAPTVTATATATATLPATAAPAPGAEMAEQKTTPFVKGGDGAPGSVLDLAPTVQTPMQPPPSISAQQEAPARLVVVSSNFAGQEFVLDKAAVVIGRTDENDVVVNHRSISRHHAKIVREGGHYHIVDLQSANGVRVNGEEYGKVELRKGDHVDLGHVRLRFVAPGEDFIFDRDAQVVDVSGAKKSRAGLFAVLALVLVALAGGAFVLVKLTQRNSAGDPAGAFTRPSGDTEGAVARLLLDADKAMKNEEWESAIAKCDEALKLDPAQELARDKRQRAEAERKNRTAYQNFLNAADGSPPDFDSAVASYGEVAEDSVYRQKGAERYAQVKKLYLRAHLDAARKAKASNKCEEARQHVEAALTVEEGNVEAQDILKSCGATTRPVGKGPAAPDHKTGKAAAAAATAGKKEKTAPAEDGNGDVTPNPAAEKLLQDAQDAYVHGQYANAIDTAKKAAKAQPMRAWRIIGAASCFLKDRNGAMQAWNKLGPQERSFLKYVCSRNAITVP